MQAGAAIEVWPMIDFAGPCFILAELPFDRSPFGGREWRLVSLEP